MSQIEMKLFPIASDARSRDQQDIMAFPVCSLSKNKRTDTITFQEASTGNWVEVSPNPKYGMVTIWDMDIILYFVSLIRHRIEKKEDVPTLFKVTAYDILKFCGRDTGKSQYAQLRQALGRLGSTVISTNIREDMIGDEEIERKDTYLNFTFISYFKEHTRTIINKRTGKKKEVTSHFEIQLPEWLVDGAKNDSLVLRINPEYFQLKGGLERWLYRTARKFSGISEEHGVRYTIKHLHARSGSKAEYRKFKYQLKQTIEQGNIPDHHFRIYTTSDGKDWLHIVKRNPELSPEEEDEKWDTFIERITSKLNEEQD